MGVAAAIRDIPQGFRPSVYQNFGFTRPSSPLSQTPKLGSESYRRAIDDVGENAGQCSGFFTGAFSQGPIVLVDG
jgi:hypothetical protein